MIAMRRERQAPAWQVLKSDALRLIAEFNRVRLAGQVETAEYAEGSQREAISSACPPRTLRLIPGPIHAKPAISERKAIMAAREPLKQ